MSRQPLSEADAHNELLRLELLRLEALKTELLKQQGIYKVGEAEKDKKILKRQAKFLKEAMERRPEVETLATLKRTHDFQLDMKQRSDYTNELVDEIAAKGISKPGPFRGGYQALPAGSAWMTTP